MTSKYKALLVQQGVYDFMKLIFYKILRKMSIRIVSTNVFRYDIDASRNKENILNANFRNQELSIEDFIKYSKNDRTWFTDIKLKNITNALGSSKAFGIVEGDRIISYGCVNPNLKVLSSFPLEKKACFLFDDYTHPDYRGKGLHLLSINERLDYAAKLGYQEAYISVDHFNKASYKGVSKAGFSKCLVSNEYYIGKKRKIFSCRLY